MKVLREGHLYRLDNFDNPESEGQLIQFIEKVPTGRGDGSLELLFDGTTNEEVLAVLIDRLQNLGAKFPCRENSIAVTKLQEALMWLNERTRERKARGVEGKHLK